MPPAILYLQSGMVMQIMQTKYPMVKTCHKSLPPLFQLLFHQIKPSLAWWRINVILIITKPCRLLLSSSQLNSKTFEQHDQYGLIPQCFPGGGCTTEDTDVWSMLGLLLHRQCLPASICLILNQLILV